MKDGTKSIQFTQKKKISKNYGFSKRYLSNFSFRVYIQKNQKYLIIKLKKTGQYQSWQIKDSSKFLAISLEGSQDKEALAKFIKSNLKTVEMGLNMPQKKSHSKRKKLKAKKNKFKENKIKLIV